MPIENDSELAELLRAVRTIAVVGIKAGPEDDAFRVPRYMRDHGYRILPISPKLDDVLGERCASHLGEWAKRGSSPDLVNVFRAPAHVPAHVEEILALARPPRAVWLQLGIRHPQATARLEAAGIAVVEDRCLMVEHHRLLGRPALEARERLLVRVHYDLASTLCYVAHHVMSRLTPRLEELAIDLAWTPLDLTRVLPFRRGIEIEPVRRANARRVAEELGVAVHVPAVWPDSRWLGAAAVLAERRGREAAWRERAFTAVFEERRATGHAEEVAALAAEVGLEISSNELEKARDELESRTRIAIEEMVTGVPTFMLGSWPFGGIQTEYTMQRVLERFARKARAGEAM